MKPAKKHNIVKARRAKRVRANLKTGEIKPRLSIFRSGHHIYAQIIDDTTQKTVVSVSSLSLKSKAKAKKTDIAAVVGAELAEKAKKAGVATVVFDRGAYAYHGRVKALAEAARTGGLKF
ncbi:50S ribosomal protein L18 [Patescibacteria group bacterium]|nr:50S ribosomal protein L18 [Patescibacteria group bacterium]